MEKRGLTGVSSDKEGQMLFEWKIRKKAKKRMEGEVRQGRLRMENGLAGEDVVIVEKSNMVKFFVRTCAALIRTVAALTVTGLAFVGLAALIYPGPRHEIGVIFQEVIKQLIFLV